MKIYVTGPVASGKTTLSKKFAKKYRIPCFSLDDVVHEALPVGGNRRRSEGERDGIFAGILARDAWIVEDTGRECFLQAMDQADLVVLLCPPASIRKKRILTRFLKQRMGLEKSSYLPDMDMLKAMFRWSRNFDSGADGLKNRVSAYRHKLLVIEYY